jgi:D-ribose pyranose/furanose isomerase RbsD
MELWLGVTTFIAIIAVIKSEINMHQLRVTLETLEKHNIDVPHFNDPQPNTTKELS